MKIFAIRDRTDKVQKDLAYLLYYETEKQFYIELLEDADPWETPLILDSFVKRGEHTVNSYWSRLWVQQRIVPTDRQNIGQILKDNGLKAYDEYALLMLSNGRCEQDDYYIVPMDEKALPKRILRRFQYKIEDVLPLNDRNLLVFFRDGTVKKCALTEYFEKNPPFSILLKRDDFFHDVRIQTGGYGVQWDENLSILDSELYKMGKPIPLSAEDFKEFASKRVINTAEAADILECSRQYINELVKKELLHPIKASEKNTLFLMSEVQKRKWQ